MICCYVNNFHIEYGYKIFSTYDVPSRYILILIKIKQENETSVNSELVQPSCESTGFKLNLSQCEASLYSFSDDFK